MIEVKNLKKSFGELNVLNGINEHIEKGEKVIQQTLHWNDAAGVTTALRSKEEAHDYRYFPEPDIPPIFITDEEIEDIKAKMPEMPDSRKARYIDFGLTEADASLLIADKTLSDYFEKVINCSKRIRVWRSW